MQTWYKVKVHFDTFIHYDEIKGINEEDALKNAYWNWENALHIELV